MRSTACKPKRLGRAAHNKPESIARNNCGQALNIWQKPDDATSGIVGRGVKVTRRHLGSRVN